MNRIKIFFLATVFFPTTAVLAQPFQGKMGVGLDGIGGISLEFPNVTLTASAWESVANSGQSATTDTAGWPTEDFRVLFFDFRPFGAWAPPVDDPQKYVVDMSGTYKLSFSGQANLSSWSDAPVQFQNKVYTAVTNVTTVDIVFPPGGGANQANIGNHGFCMINFLQTNYNGMGTGVKNIRLTRPGYQHNNPQPYGAEYLNALSPFSTIRFMDYLSTNNSDKNYPNITTWAQRQKTYNPRYNRAPWELVIALANYTARDIWINIPVDADDNYVTELAKLMKNTLRPEVNIYIEYSNEVWNGGFTQYQYNYDAVLNSAADADIRASTTFDDRRRARRVAKRVIRFGQLFEQEFGVTVASRTRIRPVFAWQIGGWLPWYDDVLNWINTAYGPPKNFIYGIASAPYFNDQGAAANATAQQVVAAMSANSDANVNAIKTLAQYANQWNLKHLQYEGGPDNGGGSTTNLANRITANRITEMKTAVIHNYKDNWFSANANGTAPLGTNDLANYFVMSGRSSRYGCWGATEDLKYIKSLSNAPKYDALCILTGMCGNEPTIALTTPVNNAIVYVGNSVPVTANASDPDGTVKKVEFFVGSTLIGADSTAPYSVTWAPTQPGIYAVLAKSIDNNGKFTFADANVVEVKNSSTGIKGNNEGTILIYPNPANDELNVYMPKTGIFTAEIFDLAGRAVYAGKSDNMHTTISVKNIETGIYLIKITDEKEVLHIKKIIIEK